MQRQAGIMLSEIPFSNMPVLLKSAGLDYFILDCEHGGFDYAEVSRILMTARLCGLASIVRLADNTRKDIIKFMDMGADGVLLQMTSSAKDIEQVVSYAKYAPLGRRGISTMRAHTGYNPPPLPEYMEQANQKVRVYAQIETVLGVQNIAEILAVKGVDGFLMGPSDLSCEYGCLDNPQAPAILEAIDLTASASAAAGKISGIITSNKTYLDRAKMAGMTMFCVGSELSMLKSATKQMVKSVLE